MANRMRYWKPSGNIFSIAAACGYEKDGAVQTEKEAASQMARYEKRGPRGPLSICTIGVWEKEAMLMRCAEKLILRTFQRRLQHVKQEEFGDTSQFIKPIPERPRKPSIIDRFLDRIFNVGNKLHISNSALFREYKSTSATMIRIGF
jgi:phosphatidylglycerophosphatase GEP4